MTSLNVLYINNNKLNGTLPVGLGIEMGHIASHHKRIFFYCLSC